MKTTVKNPKPPISFGTNFPMDKSNVFNENIGFSFPKTALPAKAPPSKGGTPSAGLGVGTGAKAAGPKRR